jgi:SPP1 family predicted phage head-tail adaptor
MLRLKNISDKNSVSLDLVCYLPTVTITQDEIGNDVETVVDRLVYCAELPLNSSEFYNAGQRGIKPEHLLTVDVEEYDGETSVLYQDVRYNIYRNFTRSDGLIELYCNTKVGA